MAIGKIYKRYPQREVRGEFRQDKVLWVGIGPKKWIGQNHSPAKRLPTQHCQGQSLKEVQQSIMRIEGLTK